MLQNCVMGRCAICIFMYCYTFLEYITDLSPTICALTETWLSNDEADLRFKDVLPKGYSIISRPQPGHKKGGRVAVVHKSNLIVKAAPPSDTTSDVMEHLDLTTNFKGISVNLYVIYHIPNTSVMQFCSNIVHDRGCLILTGDFNIHMDNPENPDTIIFNDFLESFGLTNFVSFPTHQSNHTIDLMITHHSSIIKSVRQGGFFSDHCFINANLHIDWPIPPKKIVTYRKLKKLTKSSSTVTSWMPSSLETS